MTAKNIKKKPAPKEADITRSIRAYLRSIGVFHYKQWQGLGSKRGVSDIIGIYKGKYLAIEVKTPRGKLSEHQEKFLQAVNLEGGIGFVARSVDDVINGLDKYQ